MERVRFDKLNIEIEVKANEISLFEIKELGDRAQIFFKNKKILDVLPNSKIEICNCIICYKGRVVAFNDTRVEAWGRSVVTAYDSSYVAGHNRSTIRAHNTSGVMGCDECVIRAYNAATVTGFDSSFIIARDNVNCIAFQGAEVRASGHAKIRALDSSRVTARGYARVDLEGKSIGYKKPFSRAKINVLDNRAAVFES